MEHASGFRECKLFLSAQIEGIYIIWKFLVDPFHQFADTDLLKRAGFSSRKAMKTAMYERAKVSLSRAVI